jgi:arabinose-5-phosphate isomerase
MTKKVNVVSEAIRVLQMEGNAILSCAERLQHTDKAVQLEKALEIIHRSLIQGGKIVVTGVGKSGKVGQKIAATLSSTGSLAIFLHPTEGLHGDLGVIRPEDVVLALSYTGNTEELIRLIPSFKNLNIPIIGLGGNSSSQLARHCNAWVDAQIEMEACPHNLAPTTSTTLALALGDSIAVALMQLRGFDAQAFAQFHPGGSLGRKLNLKVADLMHSGKDLPCVGPLATMKEVIVKSTEKKLGAVLVAEENRLLGIITDGDIRRSLQLQEKFFHLSAREVMTADPIVATPEMMAQAALALMENRPSQISVLPVVDAEKNCKGILRLHDLVRAF